MRLYDKVILGTLALLFVQESSQQANAQVNSPDINPTPAPSNQQDRLANTYGATVGTTGEAKATAPPEESGALEMSPKMGQNLLPNTLSDKADAPEFDKARFSASDQDFLDTAPLAAEFSEEGFPEEEFSNDNPFDDSILDEPFPPYSEYSHEYSHEDDLSQVAQYNSLDVYPQENISAESPKEKPYSQSQHDSNVQITDEIGPEQIALAEIEQDDLFLEAPGSTSYLAQLGEGGPEEDQRLESLREQYLLPELTDTDLLDQNPSGALGSPGTAIGVPSAFGASWRNVFAGLTFQERTRFSDRSDGAMSVGFGLGDAETAVGLEVAIAIVDLLGEGAFEDGTVSVKLHRQLGDGWAIAAGIENLATFGNTDGGSSGYGVVTKVTELRESDKPFNTLTTSVGLGGGRFRPEGRLNQDEVNVFGSVALRVADPVSLIADWSGQDLNLGVSVVPFANLPLVVTPAAVDVTGSAGDGVRFSLGIGIGHTF